MEVIESFNGPMTKVAIGTGNNVTAILGRHLQKKFTPLAAERAWLPLLKQGQDEPFPLEQKMPLNIFSKTDYAGLRAYFEVGKVRVLSLVGKESPVQDEWEGTYSTHDGLQGLKREIKAAIQSKKHAEKVAKKQKVIPAPEHIEVNEFILYDRQGSEAHALTEENALRTLLGNPVVYFDYAAHSYSRMVDSILDKFRYSFNRKGVNVKDLYQAVLDNNTHQAEQDVETFLANMEASTVSRTKERWNQAVARATEVLEDYALTIPELEVYNGATRRLLINPILQQTSKFLGGKMLLEAYLCQNQAHPPPHFVGTGPLDFVSCIKGTSSKLGASEGQEEQTFPTEFSSVVVGLVPTDNQVEQVVAELQGYMEQEETEEGGGEEGQAEWLQNATEHTIVLMLENDVASATALPLPDTTSGVVEEAKKILGLEALKQLMGQHHDRFFVSDDDLLHLANPVGDEVGREKVLERAGLKVGGGSGGTKRKRTLPETSTRVHKKVYGVLTTGHTWQVYRFSLGSDDLNVDPLNDLNVMPLMELIGVFRVPVLQDRRTNGASGAKPTTKLDKRDVARVMAVLVLAAQRDL